MKAITLRTTLAAISGVGFACTAAAWVSLVPVTAIAQSMSGGQNHKSGVTGMGGMSSASPGMGSSGGAGLSSHGSSSFGGASGGIGQRSSGSSMKGFGGGGGAGSGGLAGSRAGASGSRIGSTGHKVPKLKLKPASEASAGSSGHSIYDYTYGAEATGRNADAIYKSRDAVAPTDNYKFGATDYR